jgi:hypothetical protein
VAFNLEDYEPVEERLSKWWKENEDGRVATELISFSNGQYIVQAYLYRTYLDSVAYATGLAEEKITDRGVNATSALENCETSAIGRALANANYAAKGKRPSREEMKKVVQHPVQGLVVVPELDAASFASTWEIYGDKNVKEPTQTAQVIALVQAELGAKPVPVAPMCQHGEMQRKIGINAKGEYSGWVCANNGAPRAEQCPAKWDKK